MVACACVRLPPTPKAPTPPLVLSMLNLSMPPRMMYLTPRILPTFAAVAGSTAPDLRQPLLLQHQIQLVALDDAELVARALVLGELRVDGVAGGRSHIVEEPVLIFGVVIEFPDGDFDLGLRIALQRKQ